MGFKAVIFDLDGTLIDSIDGIAYSMNIVLKRHGHKVHHREAYKAFVGHGIRELVKKSFTDVKLDDKMVTQCFAEMKEVYSKNWHYNMTVYDGIHELLGFLSKNNIFIAVNTNKEEDISREIIEKYLPMYNFTHIVGGNAHMKKKPDPSGAEMISGKLGVLPDECIYVGDSEVDIQTALNANMFLVSVLWGFRTKKELVQAGAPRLIQKPSELIEMI